MLLVTSGILVVAVIKIRRELDSIFFNSQGDGEEHMGMGAGGRREGFMM